MAIDDNMTTITLARAKTHTYNVCQTGGSVFLIKAGTKDRMGTILTESALSLKTFPVRFTPFDRKTTLKISWAENVAVIFYVATKELDLLSLTIKDLKHYVNVRYADKEYEIAYVDDYSAFAGGFLYAIIGAKL